MKVTKNERYGELEAKGFLEGGDALKEGDLLQAIDLDIVWHVEPTEIDLGANLEVAEGTLVFVDSKITGLMLEPKVFPAGEHPLIFTAYQSNHKSPREIKVGDVIAKLYVIQEGAKPSILNVDPVITPLPVKEVPVPAVKEGAKE